MPSRIHAIIPKVAIGIGLLAPVLGVAGYLMYTQPYEPAPDTDVFAVVEGRWAWTTADSGCTNEWHRIAFTPDRTVMTIAAARAASPTPVPRLCGISCCEGRITTRGTGLTGSVAPSRVRSNGVPNSQARRDNVVLGRSQ